jgi:replicative DNA helicase
MFTTDNQNSKLIPTPPQALDMEEAVLGALLLEKDAYFRISGMLSSKMFYKQSNQIIFDVVAELVAQSEPVDILTVKHALKAQSKLSFVGGATYLADLTNRVASSANIESHASVVAEKYIKREIISRGNEMIKSGYLSGSDAFEILDQSEQALFGLSQQSIKKGFKPISDLTIKTLDKMEAVRSNPGSVSGMPTRFTELDKMLSGLHKTDLVVLAARPAMGKTALALQIARNIAANPNLKGAGFFSLEMGAVQLTQRLIVAESEMDAQKVRNGTLEDYEWKQMLQRIPKLSKSNIFIDDTPAVSIGELRTKARKLKREKDIDVLIVDYLQLMRGSRTKSANREQEISSISRGLKIVAKELDVCVIALSQLNRSVESRGGNKKPMLSDLRESGAIEQDADIVLFLYRPEYYGFETDDEGNSTLGLAEVIIAKQRNGPTGTAKLQFISKYGKFQDWNPSMDSFSASDSLLKVPSIEKTSYSNLDEPDF